MNKIDVLIKKKKKERKGLTKGVISLRNSDPERGNFNYGDKLQEKLPQVKIISD